MSTNDFLWGLAKHCSRETRPFQRHADPTSTASRWLAEKWVACSRQNPAGRHAWVRTWGTRKMLLSPGSWGLTESAVCNHKIRAGFLMPCNSNWSQTFCTRQIAKNRVYSVEMPDLAVWFVVHASLLASASCLHVEYKRSLRSSEKAYKINSQIALISCPREWNSHTCLVLLQHHFKTELQQSVR